MFTLEICAFNIRSCITAAQSGAQRVELCDNFHEGGTSPSFGMIRSAREQLQIDLYPIIRPRGGDFLYNEEEYAVMKKDIELCKILGCNGVVIGLLNQDGGIDIKRTAALVELAYPLGVTFHRAFDRAIQPLQALEDIIETGCERILTSGQQPAIMEGLDLVKSLVELARERIVIMPGAGLRSDNVGQVANHTGAKEFHTTAKRISGSQMAYINPSMKESLNYMECDGDEVSRIVTELKSVSTKASVD